MKIFDIAAFVGYLLFCIFMFMYLIFAGRIIFAIVFFIVALIVLFYTIVNGLWSEKKY